jgi:hypothetical protein
MEKKPFSPGDLFQLERMIAPTILKLVYWLGLAGIGIYMLVTAFGALSVMQYSPAAGLGTFFLATIGGVFGFLFWRVAIETCIIFFSINDKVGELRDTIKSREGK